MTQGPKIAMLIRMKHLFQKQPNGVFYFRKRIPTDLVKKLGKKMFMISLQTHDPIKAQAQARRLDKEIQAEWDKVRSGESERGSVLDAQRLLDSHSVGIEVEGHGDLGLDLLLDKLMDKQPRALMEEYNGSYGVLDDSGANLTPTEKKALQLIDGTITLSDAVEYYIEMSGNRDNRKFVNSARRSLSFFVDALGDRPIDKYRRREIEERLVNGVQAEGLKTATVSRRLSDVKSAVNKVILNFEYHFKNPFEKHTIPNLREDEESRTSLTRQQQNDLINLFGVDGDRDTINGLKILFDTGMRVSECIGLRTEDIFLNDEVPHIKLHRNPFRRLKTKQSQRLIPLIGYALEGVKSQLNNSQGSEWVFPRYVDENKQTVRNDSASAAMNKRTEAFGFTCHSLRHNMKDRLRLANVSMENIRELQGWSRGDQASRYGEMSLIELLYNDMKKVDLERT